MSDSVHFWEAKIGNAAGEKGFPIDFDRTLSVPESTAPQTHPVAMSLQDIATLWFRIAGWTATTDIGADNGTNSCTVAGGALLSLSSSPPTRELPFFLADNFTAGSDFWTYRCAPVGSLLNFIMFNDSKQICDASGVFYPGFEVDGAAVTGTSPADVGVNFDSYNIGGTPDAVGTCHIEGLSVPVSIPVFITVGSIDGRPTSVTGTTLTLTPALWWPYQGADGNPIYDTATGVALQDPGN